MCHRWTMDELFGGGGSVLVCSGGHDLTVERKEAGVWSLLLSTDGVTVVTLQ